MVKFWERIRGTPNARDIKEKEARLEGYEARDTGQYPVSESSGINAPSRDGYGYGYPGSQVNYSGSQISYPGSQISQETMTTLKGSSRDSDSFILESSFDDSSVTGSRSSKEGSKDKKKMKEKGKKKKSGKEVVDVGGVGLIPYPDVKELMDPRESTKGKRVKDEIPEKDKWIIHIDANKDKSVLKSIQRDGKKRTTLEWGSSLEKPEVQPSVANKRSTIERGSGLAASKGSLRDSKTSLKKDRKKSEKDLKEKEGKEIKKKESKEEQKKREKEEKEMRRREKEEKEREEKEAKKRQKEEEELQRKLKEEKERNEKEEKRKEKERLEKEEKEMKKREKEEKKRKDKEKRNSLIKLFDSGDKREPLPTHPEENRWSLSEREKRAVTLQAGVQAQVVYRRDKDKQGPKDDRKRHSTSDFMRRRSREFDSRGLPPPGFERFVADEFRQRSSSLKMDQPPARYLVHVRPGSTQAQGGVTKKPSIATDTQPAPVQPAGSAKELSDPNDLALSFLQRNYLSPRRTSGSSSSSPKPGPLAPQASEESLTSTGSNSQKKAKPSRGHLRNDSGSTNISSSSRSSGYSAMKAVPENPEIIRKKAYDIRPQEEMTDEAVPCPKLQPSLPAVNTRILMTSSETKSSPDSRVKQGEGKMSSPARSRGIESAGKLPSPKVEPGTSVKLSHQSPKSSSQKLLSEFDAKPKVDKPAVQAEVKLTSQKESRIPKLHAKSPEQNKDDLNCPPEPVILEPPVQEVVFHAPPPSVDIIPPKPSRSETPKNPPSSNLETECVYNITEIQDVNLNQRNTDSKIQYDREKVTSSLIRTNKSLPKELGAAPNGSSSSGASADSTTVSDAQGTPKSLITASKATVVNEAPVFLEGKLKNTPQSQIPIFSKDGPDIKKKTRETISVACDRNGAIETTFGADIEFMDADSAVEESENARSWTNHVDSSVQRESLLIVSDERHPKFVQLEAPVPTPSTQVEEQVPQDIGDTGVTVQLPEKQEPTTAATTSDKKASFVEAQEEQQLELDQKTPRKSSVSQIKGAHQPDLVSNSIGSRAHAAQEISRLEALCEGRTKELNYAKMQLKAGIQGFDAMSIIVQYLTSELDAFSMPDLQKKMAEMQERMQILTTDLDELKEEKVGLETMTHDLIQSHKETTETIKEEHRTQLDALEDRLGVKHEEHIQRLHDQHSEEVKTLKSYHDKQLSEIKTEHESASQELLKRQRQQLREIEERDVRHLTELQKQHEAKLHEITHRFEDIKVTLSDKVYTLKAECDELRNRSQMYEQALQRDTDIKVQPGETVQDRLEKLIDEKARLALLPYRDLPQEIESLKAVLDMKNQEIHELRTIKATYEKQLEDLPPAQERIRSLEQKIENLEAIINIKSDYEKQLNEKHHILMRRYDRESKANKRLSMDNEELMWRLTEDAPELLSPGPGKKIPSRSPSNLSEPSGELPGKRSRSPWGGALSPGSEEVATMISKVPMRRPKSRTSETSEKRTSLNANTVEEQTQYYQTL